MPLGAHRNQHGNLHAALAAFEAAHGQLPGLGTQARRDTLVEQIISSLRRIEYVSKMVQGGISQARSDPSSDLFDPLRAAVLSSRQGHLDQAVWMTFYATQFGKHLVDGWKLSRSVYSSFEQGPTWDFTTYAAGTAGFSQMLHANSARLASAAHSGRYSNHRQYESRRPAHLAQVFESFYNWMTEYGGFWQRVQAVHMVRGQNPTEAFDELYKSADAIFGFGRLGKFDFLTMVGKLGLAPIEPGSVYLKGATGPLKGARLLFANNRDAGGPVNALEENVNRLDQYLSTGKQVIEDSLCNWQKSPDHYIYFRG
jgi:hypothetical protein